MGLFDPDVTNEVTTTTSTPWDVQAPYLDYGFNQQRQLYDRGGPAYYGGNTYTPMAPQTEAGISSIENAALSGGYGVDAAANRQARDTLGGTYLNSNPYLDQTYNTAADRARRSIDSQFAGKGRYGSNIHQDIMGENLMDLSGKIYGDNYQKERDRQLRMASIAPTISRQNYYGGDALIGAGGIVKDQANEALQADMDRWSYNQNLPYQNLDWYNAGIGGDFGRTETMQSPLYSNSTGTNILGGIGAGLGILSDWGDDDWDSFKDLWS